MKEKTNASSSNRQILQTYRNIYIFDMHGALVQPLSGHICGVKAYRGWRQSVCNGVFVLQVKQYVVVLSWLFDTHAKESRNYTVRERILKGNYMRRAATRCKLVERLFSAKAFPNNIKHEIH